MKIFSKKQLYEADKQTIKNQNLTSLDLMERAGIQVFNWLHVRMQGAQVPIYIFCGTGNNGGDGLVLARHLFTHGYNVKPYVVNFNDNRSDEFLKNYERLKQTSTQWPEVLKADNDLPKIHPNDIIIDAIFGIGLNREIDNWIVVLFKHLKASKAFTLSIDVPSGLKLDEVPKNNFNAVWANYTLSIQVPKLIFFLPQTAKFVGQWELIDIGLDQQYLSTTITNTELIGKNEVLQFYKPRKKFSHKGTFGHIAIVGGSYGKIGAVTLATKAALASGCGLATAYIPKCGYIPLQSALPEAMAITDETDYFIKTINLPFSITAVGIGVGYGLKEESVSALQTFLKTNTAPLVIDADALNILAKKKKLLNDLKPQTILTPHLKELERLIGSWTDDFDKIKKAKTFSKKYDIILVIKGFNTLTVYRDNLFVNSTGNPGLATAGTGDVLTGIITGLLAQQYTPLEAALFGVYLHGKSADLAVEFFGYQSLLASNVIEYLSKAYLSLFEQPEEPETEQTDPKQNSDKKDT